MLHGFVLVVHVFVCFVLVAVILLQAGRGGGLSDAFGGGAQTIFGTRGAAYLTRATTVCAVIFLLTSLSLAILSVQRGRSLMERVPAAAMSKAAAQVPVHTPVNSPKGSADQPGGTSASQPNGESSPEPETGNKQ